MCQNTRRQIADKIDSFDKDQSLPFAEILDARMVEDALAAEGVKYNRSIYTPFVTLCTFLSQVLDPDHSCRAAVARVIVWLAIHDREPCSEQTGTYCDARLRLPLGVVRYLVRRTGREVEGRAAEEWLWKRRRVLLVDGTTASMPDTPRNQAVFPQPNSQAKGLGFPLVRMVAIIALATGVVLDLATGPYGGKETGETALLRQLWERLEAGEILLGDCVFASFFGILGLTKHGVDGLFRMHQGGSATSAGVGDWGSKIMLSSGPSRRGPSGWTKRLMNGLPRHWRCARSASRWSGPGSVWTNWCW